VDFEILKELFVGVNVIDEKGEIVFSFAKEPFKDFMVKNLDELEKWFANRYKNFIPLFGEITIGENRYWIERKKVKNYILYVIEEIVSPGWTKSFTE
jgi:hypothetical protein